jgi:hypothetical protein
MIGLIILIVIVAVVVSNRKKIKKANDKGNKTVNLFDLNNFKKD